MTANLTRRQVAFGLTAAAALAGASRGAASAEPIRVVSHRTPTTEFFVKRMQDAVPGQAVDAQLVPFDKALELANLTLSSKAGNVDIVFVNDSSFLSMAKNGWLRPLDPLWDKLKDEFALPDFSPSALNALKYDGALYALPIAINPMIFFYRSDLFSAAGLKPPTTMASIWRLPGR
jgi:ABC-type glycerol-3-phosphate transport system substrate-binding protein